MKKLAVYLGLAGVTLLMTTLLVLGSSNDEVSWQSLPASADLIGVMEPQALLAPELQERLTELLVAEAPTLGQLLTHLAPLDRVAVALWHGDRPDERPGRVFVLRTAKDTTTVDLHASEHGLSPLNRTDERPAWRLNADQELIVVGPRTVAVGTPERLRQFISAREGEGLCALEAQHGELVRELDDDADLLWVGKVPGLPDVAALVLDADDGLELRSLLHESARFAGAVRAGLDHASLALDTLAPVLREQLLGPDASPFAEQLIVLKRALGALEVEAQAKHLHAELAMDQSGRAVVAAALRVVAAVVQHQDDEARDRHLRGQLSQVRSMLEVYRTSWGRVPSSVTRLVDEGTLRQRESLDPWNTPLFIADAGALTVCSAGPDTEQGSGDDLCFAGY